MSKLNTRLLTKVLVWSTVVVWILWDIYVAVEQGTPEGDTESELIRDISWDHPFFPFAVGVLMGHFFWTSEETPSRWLVVPLVVIGVAVAVLDFTGFLPAVMPVLPFLAGVPLGRFLWGQESRKELRE